MLFDTIIVGGGPGGVAAGVYCARKKMKTLFLSDSIGGQSTVSASIENWIGSETISGFNLAQMLDRHLRAQEDIDIRVPEKVKTLEMEDGLYVALSEKGQRYVSKTIIIASGGRHRHLDIPGEDIFQGKGVVYCSTCDAPFFRNKTVAVIGGGNSGLEACQDLFPYAQKIYLISRSKELTGDPATQDIVKNHPKVEIIFNALTQKILGDKVVTGIQYDDAGDGQRKELPLQGVFVEIGSVPNSDFVRHLVEVDENGAIIVDHKTMSTNRLGIFAVGDVTNSPYRQNNISAGQGVVAALSAYDFLRKSAKKK